MLTFLQALHRDLPPSPLYGYGVTREAASVPGPILVAKRGVITRIKWENHLWDYEYTPSDNVVGLITNGTVPISKFLS